ncbi:putative DNA-binding transcriptional regulator YafY [Bradyrhizobium sp. R2.2-H]|jgi:predicted DNA-binding transcriptional regulator YafY|uniref:helix-turn-helix transcriptional regulator n=1 Tax=unclassified Bradyrhizobium TaxID=2631580 RepID=UPI0010444D4D|nr:MULTISPECIES: YafY family protein [unclassified Bradyrhizobium]TCU66152.1 putative DNA-binding transcriptional regulator YafY [Bradyrhizobium sp. Y-H1]TCU67907.1 putative DNA-binding transcriptional regulator YafY [Bradyrhizobium sp. R2.2-H]
MRASRMLSILTTLQARGRVTAPALAEACEVSVRTIYRDIDALAASGVPVYADRGAEGGYRLLDGYRVRLNGLSQSEAGALFLAGLPGPAAALGLDAAMIAAQNKLMAALPETLREDAGRMQERFHLDAPGWFGEAEDPKHLRAIAGAVLRGTLIRIRYQSWRAEKQRRVAPLGLVLKGGSWYLAGQVDGSVRTYRVARVLDCTALGDRFDRPAGFDLGAYWQAATLRLEAEMHPNVAIVRLSPFGVKLLDALSQPYVKARTQLDETIDADGWRIARIPVGKTSWHAAAELLRLGPEAEVLEPADLRDKMAELTQAMAARYRTVRKA